MKNIYIKDLNIPKDWEDTYFDNDAMYSYEIGDLYNKAYGIYDRFSVVCSDKFKDNHPNDGYVDDVLFTSNDFDEVIAYVKENK